MVAAPRSGGGKTTVTLALIAALTRRGARIAPAKVGPDYIDPRYHEAASGAGSVNLDAWSMEAGTLRALAQTHAAGRDHLVVEGVMGLFDGARIGGAMAGSAEHHGHGGHGGTADIARALGLPVILVLDGSGQGQSVAAVAAGFAGLDVDVRVAGVILNNVAGARHEAMLRDALAMIGMPCLGALPRAPALARPSRHLGLVQAEEGALAAFLDEAAALAAAHIDLDALLALAEPMAPAGAETPKPLPPLGTRIAVADDVAFRFAYNHVLDGWRRAGASVHPFSPLADEAPDLQADAVFLPGGYPELHAGRLAANARFLDGLRARAAAGARVYGECGGYMVLGEGLVDADGTRHAMAGLLGLETSFAERKRHLGYRLAEMAPGAAWLGGRTVRAHEYHYTSVLTERGDALLRVVGDGSGLGASHAAGLRQGSVFGSFLHLIAEDAGSRAGQGVRKR
ncbi:MAG: cobyrinate a,c-diamide synthase [Pseudomonadota bacterium]